MKLFRSVIIAFGTSANVNAVPFAYGGFMLALSAFPLFADTCVTPPTGLVAWWRAEGNALDAAGTNNGSLINNVSFATGRVGQAFSFDGATQRVDVSNTPDLEITGPVTVEAWIMPHETSVQHPIVEKYGVTTGGYGLRLDANRIQFFTIDNCCTFDLLSGSSSLVANTWYHVAGMWTGTNIQVYVNGVLDGVINSTRNPKAGTTPLRIGARGDLPTVYFDGLIDEAAVYNRALSANEIAGIYNAGIAGKCVPSNPPNDGFSQGIISVNFVGGRAGNTPSSLASNEVTGVVPAADWNNVAPNIATGSHSNLVNDSGTLTAATLVWASDNTWDTVIAQTDPNFKMMKGYLDNPSSDVTVSVSGVPYSNYDVYVYFNDDNTSGGTVGSYTIGARKIFGKSAVLFNGSFIRASGTNAADANALGNYVVFQALSDANFTLVAHPEDAVHRSPVNGLQIVAASTNIFPEPVVFGWGFNAYGQATPPPDLSHVTAIAAGIHSLALQSNGTVRAWGYNNAGQTNVPPGLTAVRAIAAGTYHSMALKSNGTVVAWGLSADGETNVPSDLSDASAIAAGGYHSLALRSNGTVAAWGYSGSGVTNVPSGLSTVRAIAGGRLHSLALRSNGTVIAWGDNTYGKTNVPSGLSGIQAIAAGGEHNLALKSNGTVVAWGDNTYGQTNVPSNLSNVVAIAAGSAHSVALKSDGTVVAWGLNSADATNVPAGLRGVVAVAAGSSYNLTLTHSPPLTVACPNSLAVPSFAAVPPPDPDSIVVSYNCGTVSKTFESDVYQTNGCEINIARTYRVVDSCNRLSTCGQVITASNPPVNDQCSGAIPISEGFIYTVDTTCATSTGDPIPDCVGGNVRGVWYKFTPTDHVAATISTCGSSFDTVVQVYTGECGALTPLSNGCNDNNGVACFGSEASVRFDASAFTTYWIFAGGYGEQTGILTIHPTTQPICDRPLVQGTTSYSVEEPGGIRVYYQAFATGTPPFTYEWTFFDSGSSTLFTINSSSDTVSHLFGPFDSFPASFNVIVRNTCGFDGSNGSTPPPCGAICLSVGVPYTRTGTDGSGANNYSLASSCGSFATGNSRWFLMSKLTNAAAIASISSEGSAADTMIGVFRGGIDPANLFPLTCSPSSNNRPARVEFETRPGSNYWLAVITTNPAALRLTYGYDLKFATVALNATNRTLDLRSAPLPSLQYQLLASTNPASGPAAWSVVLTTNFTGNVTASNNVLRFVDTNISTNKQRFYRLKSVP